MNTESKIREEEIDKRMEELEKEADRYRREISDLEDKEQRTMNEIRELNAEKERLHYSGLTQLEYFKGIRYLVFTEGRFKVKIGEPDIRSVRVSTKEDDVAVTVTGSNPTSKGYLELYAGTSQTRKKLFSKSYTEREVPKKWEELYNEMAEIKNRYLDYMHKGEINAG